MTPVDQMLTAEEQQQLMQLLNTPVNPVNEALLTAIRTLLTQKSPALVELRPLEDADEIQYLQTDENMIPQQGAGLSLRNQLRLAIACLTPMSPVQYTQRDYVLFDYSRTPIVDTLDERIGPETNPDQYQFRRN